MSGQPVPELDPASQRWFTWTYNHTTEQYNREWLPLPAGPLTPESIPRSRQANHAAAAPFTPQANVRPSLAFPPTAGPALPMSPGSYNSGFNRTSGSMFQSPPQHSYSPLLPSPYLQSPQRTSNSSGVFFRPLGPRITPNALGLSHLPQNIIDPSHQVRLPSFFCEGRVLAIVWNQNAGTNATRDYNTSNSTINAVKYEDNLVHTQQRRFVVVRKKQEFCYACPMFTYSKQGTLKKGVRSRQHAIAYSVGQEPKVYQGEDDIREHPMGVVMAQGEPALHVASRIYFGIQHAIQFNTRVKDIGRVRQEDMPFLIGYCKEEEKRDEDFAADMDEYTYDASKNPAGFHRTRNPQAYHPTHNPHGYHPEKAPYCFHEHMNPWGYHPKLSLFGFHPQSNPQGFHPKESLYCFHPTLNPPGYHSVRNKHGFHPQLNPYGYHPDQTPDCYHPDANPSGYHSVLNIWGYHPQANPSGHNLKHTPHCYHPEFNFSGYHKDRNPRAFHPQHNPHTYHPKYNPYSYHRKKNIKGFHSQHNPTAYHPVHNPYVYHKEENPFGFSSDHKAGYHPQTNPHGYHPRHNPYGFHPRHNPYGFHPKKNPEAYHPTSNPNGIREPSSTDDVNQLTGQVQTLST